MKVKFWGVRGSIPVPGPKTVRYGGNTTCIEVRTDDGHLAAQRRHASTSPREPMR